MSSGAQMLLSGAQVTPPGAQVTPLCAQVTLPGARVTPLCAHVMQPTICTPHQRQEIIQSSTTPSPAMSTPLPSPVVFSADHSGHTPSAAEPSFAFTPSPSTSATTSPGVGSTSRDYPICSQEEGCTKEGSVGASKRRKPIRLQKAVPTVSSEELDNILIIIVWQDFLKIAANSWGGMGTSF